MTTRKSVKVPPVSTPTSTEGSVTLGPFACDLIPPPHNTAAPDQLPHGGTNAKGDRAHDG